MNLKILMDKINISIKNNSELFGNNHDELINKVLEESDKEVKKVIKLNKPELWEEISLKRNTLKLKMDILNKIMSFNE